jgi:phosphoglycolate phosphatase-like HAD superfamily hydrolase
MPHVPSSPPTVSAPPHWIAVDSDGCVFDTMEPKHRECFVPALIEVWGLHEAAPLVRKGFLGLNLHSVHRGVNRFLALHLFWQWLDSRRPDLALIRPPGDRFEAWLRSGNSLSESALAAELARHPEDAALGRALHWSRRVNQLARSLPPAHAFVGAADALHDAVTTGTLYVVSGGNGAAIHEEWHRAGLASLVRQFHGQEAGGKHGILRSLAAQLGSENGLMIGDSLGDADAAEAAGVRFFPIRPGREAESWDEFRTIILPGLRSGRYSAVDANIRTAAFRAKLADCAATLA